VSLLEVLISIFVILIGVLGVAAVIPAGRAELVEAAKADRSSACGASAVQFLQTTGYFSPRLWIYCAGSCSPLIPTTQSGSVPGSLAIPFSGTGGGPFVVDPLYYARQFAVGNTANLNVFPIPPTSPPTVRVSYPQTTTTPWSQPIAERFFLCQDDLVIPVPKDRSERPRQFMTDSSSPPRNVAVPTHPADHAVTSGTYYVRQAQGDYSWMFTVNPVAAQPDFTPTPPATSPPPYLNVGVGEYYSVSVAVFYKRNFNAPNAPNVLPGDIGEPIGTATFSTSYPNPSLGGGDVTLGAPSSTPSNWPNTVTFTPAWLDVKQNEWILLGGYTPPTSQGYQRYVLRWYRIVALGEITGQGSAATRPATLAGPDWDLTNSAGAGAADVVLYRGVVDVHTTTMKLTD
jgi:hypothetical protein